MGIRILLVEDEDEIADFVVRGLRELGFTVERAGSRLDMTAKEHSLLVRAFGGSLSISSTFGVGSKRTVSLPEV